MTRDELQEALLDQLGRNPHGEAFTDEALEAVWPIVEDLQVQLSVAVKMRDNAVEQYRLLIAQSRLPMIQ